MILEQRKEKKITKVIINRVRKQLNNKTTEDLYRVGQQLKEFSQPPPAEPFISGEGVEKVLFQVAQYEQCQIYPIFDIYSVWLSKRLSSCHLDHFQEIGFIVLTTSLGIMDHEEARKKKTGGKVLGYFY